MKKTTLISMMVLSLVLAACGTAQTGSSTPGSSTAEALPAASRLILGTFKLEGSEEAVTGEQAAELLPLWQVYAALTRSDTAAQAEIEALVEQIQETMTPGQVEAIEAMSLTQADVMTVMAEQKIVEAAPQAGTTVNVSGGAPQGRPDGGIPPGDMGGDPAMTGGAVPVSAQGEDTISSTVQAPGLTRVPSALVEALIQLLQGKSQ